MKLFIISLGVCVLLTMAQTHARTNLLKKFPDGWRTTKSVPSSDLSRDFMIEGSGKDNIDNTHEDDEDFKVTSGDEPDKDMITVEPDTYTSATVTAENKDNNQSVTKGTTDDEDLDAGSGSGEEPVEDPIVPVHDKPNNLEPVATTATPKPLTPCENLRLRSLNLSQFVPECDADGNFQKMQCKTDEKSCWCVNTVGMVISGTMFKHPQKPDCEYAATRTTPVQTTKPPTTTKTTRTTSTTARSLPELNKEDPDVDFDNKVEDTDVVIDEKLDNFNKDGNVNEKEANIDSEPTVHEPILAQPGLLAAIIGGAVVGLLFMIVLMMFIVYRMRKKDESSYPLDDHKYQNYTYSKELSDKELYA